MVSDHKQGGGNENADERKSWQWILGIIFSICLLALVVLLTLRPAAAAMIGVSSRGVENELELESTGPTRHDDVLCCIRHVLRRLSLRCGGRAEFASSTECVCAHGRYRADDWFSDESGRRLGRHQHDLWF